MHGSTTRNFRLLADGLSEMSLEAGSLDGASQALPRGAYTTFRTYHGTMALHLTGHLDRLTDSARLEGHQLSLDHGAVRRGLMAALARADFAEARVRLTLGYGDPPGALFISLEPFNEPPASQYQHGVRCVTAPQALHRETPRAKSTAFIAAGSEARRALPAGVNEVLLLGEGGTILEGTSSNFYAVVDGTLRTADAGVLAGITRGMVLRLAEGLLPVVLEPVTLGDLPRLQEAWITSVSRAVLPVVAIDDQAIGAGLPGPVAQELLRRFNAAIEADLEPILEASDGS